MDRGYISEKASTSSMDGKQLGGVAVTLDQRRKAALAEVDNANFSCVLFSCLA